MILPSLLVAQDPVKDDDYPTPTSTQKRFEYAQRYAELQAKSLIANLPSENIGPTIMSGRVTDLAANPQKPTNFYVAYASGGLWFTKNNGHTFEPLFQAEMAMTIGDIAVQWNNPPTIWVGSGENNSSRSSYAGTGLYKSTDGGKTWEHKGLKDSHHIGRIVLHPTNPDILWVAVLGHLYSDNAERGIYKSTDGGTTWQKVLYIDAKTGFIDLEISPTNPAILYAASWERDRKAWHFKGSGKGSGIYRSADAGKTWQKLNTAKNGFPSDAGVGRIGLAVANDNFLYAILDNQNRRPAKADKDIGSVLKTRLKTMSAENFLQLADSSLKHYLKDNNFPAHYTPSKVKAEVKAGKYTPKALVDYLNDANQQLFDTPVKGAEVYVSRDAGKTWQKTHPDYIDDFYYSYGYYFGQIRINPSNPEHLYIMGVPLLFSEDGGKNWTSISAENVHADHHALWLHPTEEGYLINGNDGGVNISHDNGKNWEKCNSVPVGQFYTVNIDNRRPFNVYGGLQDNGVWYGSNTYESNKRWHQEGLYPYQRLLGGDGMQVAVDTAVNPPLVYTGYQFGHYFKIDRAKDKRTKITPRHKLGERPYRFNWQTPIHLSIHNRHVIYLGSNKFHRSLNGGRTFYTNPRDLTKGGQKGNVPYGTITTLSESDFQFGLIYVGTDDGLVHVTFDGGYTWKDISKGLPNWYWVSRVVASKHKKGRVYVSLNGYRWDDFGAYIYVSEDYGKTWQAITKNLPAEPVNVLKEDPINRDLLYLGTDNGCYISVDRGQNFMPLTKNFPRVAVHDLVINERDKQLVIGTHGRSFYKVPIKDLQMLSTIEDQDLHIFAIEDVHFNKNWGEKEWSKWFGHRTPEVEWGFYSKQAGEIEITILDAVETVLFKTKQEVTKGINYLDYNLQDALKRGQPASNGKHYLPIGNYTFRIKKGRNQAERNFKIIDSKP